MKQMPTNTTLSFLLTKLDENDVDSWLSECRDNLSGHTHFQLAEILRDIAIELKSKTSISDVKRDAIERLKEILLAKTLEFERESSLSSIQSLRAKIAQAPEAASVAMRQRLDNLESQVLESDHKSKSIQERLVSSAKAESGLLDLQKEFELESQRKTLEQDIADRVQDRKSRRLDIFSNKDTISNILGGVLLFILAIALVASMWCEPIEGSLEVVKSGFFIILGFFFGQRATSGAIGKER
ncbi:hypothetical protein [uncultured Paraglaciecola sp.]|uniref:hypothetical protein n=1 Tax=uncultured Paraglaciecola sp. TaxID=1765024 RepID=UPI002599B87C|nr:hypothetical protein [uncultured Paraglaciecola sp.]